MRNNRFGLCFTLLLISIIALNISIANIRLHDVQPQHTGQQNFNRSLSMQTTLEQQCRKFSENDLDDVAACVLIETIKEIG